MVGALVSLLGVREEVASDVEHFGTADGRIFFSLLLKIRTFNYKISKPGLRLGDR
jgi:hypothetical protein